MKIFYEPGVKLNSRGGGGEQHDSIIPNQRAFFEQKELQKQYQKN